MIILEENKRLYLSSWQYNAARIMTDLARIVENHGGRVKPLKCAVISDRSLEAVKDDLNERIEKLAEMQRCEYQECRENAIREYKDELRDLEKFNNLPITVTHTSYISFVFDNIFYYYQVNDNPFFEFYYSKTLIINGCYTEKACSCEDKKDWLYDCFLRSRCCDADIKEAANLIFNMLVSAPISMRYGRKEKIRVPNTYDGGYHYETIVAHDKMEKLDF